MATPPAVQIDRLFADEVARARAEESARRSVWTPVLVGAAALLMLSVIAFVVLPAMSTSLYQSRVAVGAPERKEAAPARAATPPVAPRTEPVAKAEELRKQKDAAADRAGAAAPAAVAADKLRADDAKATNALLLEQTERLLKKADAAEHKAGELSLAKERIAPETERPAAALPALEKRAGEPPSAPAAAPTAPPAPSAARGKAMAEAPVTAAAEPAPPAAKVLAGGAGKGGPREPVREAKVANGYRKAPGERDEQQPAAEGAARATQAEPARTGGVSPAQGPAVTRDAGQRARRAIGEAGIEEADGAAALRKNDAEAPKPTSVAAATPAKGADAERRAAKAFGSTGEKAKKAAPTEVALGAAIVPEVVVFQTSDPERLIGQLQALAARSGATWSATTPATDKDTLKKSQLKAEANAAPAPVAMLYEVVTTSDQHDAMLTKLRQLQGAPVVDPAARQLGAGQGNGKADAPGATKDVEAGRKESEAGKFIGAVQADEDARESKQAATSPAAQQQRTPDQRIVRIQIRIELLPAKQ
jgi:hypothetical protein